MPVNRAHAQYLDVLFAHAEAGRYPSHQVLKRIEAAITDRETAERYAGLLLGEAQRQRHPSLRMLDRAGEVVTRMAVADTIQRLERDG